MRWILPLALAAFVTPATMFADEFPLTGKNTTITFVGTKPGGKHDGGFKAITGAAVVEGKDLTSLKISLEIDMESLWSDNPKLTNHLKSPDFFGIKSNPKTKFVSTKVEKAGADYKITGDMTMCGETKSLSFPATITVAGGALNITSQFAIDRTKWGMTYGQGKVDNQVKLKVSVKATK
ncbi:MAG: YceI family protein [Gemmataceae bacterium]|nr:YceI family protein [Gemmataceae bacterium]MCI0738793.1 YceI family protein [Gemmataceae bacterium]